MTAPWQDVARLVELLVEDDGGRHLFAPGHVAPVVFLTAADEWTAGKYGPGFDYLLPSHVGNEVTHCWYRHVGFGRWVPCAAGEPGAEPFTRIEQD